MKGLFKRMLGTETVEELKEVLTAKELTKEEVIQEIHDTFFTEVDRLLVEANIKVDISGTEKNVMEKASRLRSLGFSSSVTTDLSNKVSNKILDNNKKDELIEAIQHFSQKYPLYKFITIGSVKKICEKYNLIYGDVSRYTGFVPDKNLKDIENFKVKDEDKAYEKTLSGMGFGGNNWELCSAEDFVYYSNQPWSQMMYAVREKSFEICAPAKDFNMQGHELKDFKLSKIEIPDPIVLQPVQYRGNSYYLIITAWGDEAADPLVVNQINN